MGKLYGTYYIVDLCEMSSAFWLKNQVVDLISRILLYFHWYDYLSLQTSERVTSNKALTGHDLGRPSRISKEQCRVNCLREQRCQGFQIFQAYCYLKSAFGEENESLGSDIHRMDKSGKSTSIQNFSLPIVRGNVGTPLRVSQLQ